MVPDDRFTDMFPDILSDIVTELDRHNRENSSSRSYRPKLLTLASQALLLTNKPGTFESVWPTLLQLLQQFVEQPRLSNVMVWSILLVVLSIVTRRRGDLTVTGVELLPILQKVIGMSQHRDPETTVFALRLTAVFQSHCTVYSTDLVRQMTKAMDGFRENLGNRLAIEILRFFAHLVDYVSFYDSKLALESVLNRLESTEQLKSDQEAKDLFVKVWLLHRYLSGYY